MSINSVNITGNVTRDPDLRTTRSGSAIMAFGVAVNERVKNASTGQWEDKPNYIDCVMFGKRAEGLSKFLSKGMKVAVHGRLSYSSWEKDGQRRSKLEVVADEVDVMQRQQGQRGGYQRNGAAQSQGGQGYDNGADSYGDGFADEDFPF